MNWVQYIGTNAGILKDSSGQNSFSGEGLAEKKRGNELVPCHSHADANSC